MNVTIDRPNCTSCGTCWDTCPAFFEMSPDDSLSQVIEKFQTTGNKAEGTVPPELEDCVREAADLCPVQIITVA
jgi:ferredoxin